jgi:hypothetical protein
MVEMSVKCGRKAKSKYYAVKHEPAKSQNSHILFLHIFIASNTDLQYGQLVGRSIAVSSRGVCQQSCEALIGRWPQEAHTLMTHVSLAILHRLTIASFLHRATQFISSVS